MSDQLPAEVDEDANLEKRAKQMLGKLNEAVNDWRASQKRVRHIVTFSERTSENGNHTLPISEVVWNDRPEIELYFWHRDEVQKLDEVMDAAKRRVDDARPQDLPIILTNINRYSAARIKHVEKMQNILADLADESSKKESLMAKIAADGAHLAQAALHHRDKMELARKTAAIPTTAELKQRLALKYNVPVEQVEALLAAKTVDVEAG